MALTEEMEKELDEYSKNNKVTGEEEEKGAEPEGEEKEKRRGERR